MNLSTMADEIHIYPIWENVVVHKVTVESTTKILGGTYHILDGNSFTWTFNKLESVTLNDTPSTTSIFYTVMDGDQVFMGLTTTDIDYDFRLLSVSRTSLNQIRGSNGVYSFTITPQNDITLNQEWKSVGKTVTYSFIEMDSDYEMKNGYNSIADDEIEYETIVSGMGIIPKVSLPNKFASSYFSVMGYYGNKSQSVELDGPTTLNTIYYVVIHYKHNMEEVKNYELGCDKSGAIKTDGCYIYKFHDSQCKYCIAEKNQIKGDFVKTNHSTELLKGEWQTNNNEHWRTASCTKCKEVLNEYADKAAHQYPTTWTSESDGVHYRNCKVCFYEETENHTYNSSIAGWKYTSEMHFKRVACSKCGNIDDINEGSHNESGTRRDVVTPTCSRAGSYKPSCSVCDYKINKTNTLDINPNNHTGPYTKIVEVEPTCTKSGISKTKCTACNALTGQSETLSALKHDYGKEYKDRDDNITMIIGHPYNCYSYKVYTKSKCNRCGIIVTLSAYTKNEIVEHNYDSSDIYVVTGYEKFGIDIYYIEKYKDLQKCQKCGKERTVGEWIYTKKVLIS